MTTLISNDIFELTKIDHPSNRAIKLYNFKMLPLSDARQETLDLLSESIAMICNNASGAKSSIILDCADLNNIDLIASFWRLSFKKALAINNTGLDKFLLISRSVIVKSLSNNIIHIKHAGHYTKVCISREEALSELNK